MRNTDSFLRTATAGGMLVASLLAWPVTGAAQLGGLPQPLPLPIGGGGTTQTVNGIASAVQAYSLGTVTTLASSGTLSGLTDARQASQLTGSVPALLSAETLHATAIGLSDRVASQASLGNLVLGIGAISIGADAVLAQAEAAAGSATGRVTDSPERSTVTSILSALRFTLSYRYWKSPKVQTGVPFSAAMRSPALIPAAWAAPWTPFTTSPFGTSS